MRKAAASLIGYSRFQSVEKHADRKIFNPFSAATRAWTKTPLSPQTCEPPAFGGRGVRCGGLQSPPGMWLCSRWEARRKLVFRQPQSGCILDWIQPLFDDSFNPGKFSGQSRGTESAAPPSRGDSPLRPGVPRWGTDRIPASRIPRHPGRRRHSGDPRSRCRGSRA